MQLVVYVRHADACIRVRMYPAVTVANTPAANITSIFFFVIVIVIVIFKQGVL